MDKENIVNGMWFGDNYLLSSDGMSITVEEFGDKEFNRKNKETGESEIVKSFGSKRKTYHRTLQQALNHMFTNNIYNCDLSDLENIVDVVESFERRLFEFKDITIINGKEINIDEYIKSKLSESN